MGWRLLGLIGWPQMSGCTLCETGPNLCKLLIRFSVEPNPILDRIAANLLLILKSSPESGNIGRSEPAPVAVTANEQLGGGAMEAASSQLDPSQFPPQAFFLFPACTPIIHFLELDRKFMSSFFVLSLFLPSSYYGSFQATVASNGRPSNRTVVFRGFQDDSEKILINTDTRSRKIDDLKHCSFAEICWYFTDSWEQFRISGTVDVIDGTNPDPLKLQQREKSWFACSLKSRLQYMAPAPGLPSLSEQNSQTPSLDPSIGPVAAFCLLVLDTDQVDYLNLKSNERLIFTPGLSVDGNKFWTSEKVNP